ncbi:MAG: hypothetical protein Q9224_001749 [Gallowayella concinna]
MHLNLMKGIRNPPFIPSSSSPKRNELTRFITPTASCTPGDGIVRDAGPMMGNWPLCRMDQIIPPNQLAAKPACILKFDYSDASLVDAPDFPFHVDRFAERTDGEKSVDVGRRNEEDYFLSWHRSSVQAFKGKGTFDDRDLGRLDEGAQMSNERSTPPYETNE